MENQNVEVLSVKQYFFSQLIAAIPLVGIIMLLVWAFGKNGNETKVIWSKSLLIFQLAWIILFLLLSLF